MPIERFNSFVDKSGDCWEWVGSKFTTGYGAFWVNGKTIGAHRASYMLHVGPVPDDKLVCHTCDNRGCVNPEHLWVGTYADNNQDAVNKGRHVPRSGHKLTEKDVVAIINDDRSGYEIAKDYGLNQSTVSRIKRGRRWRRVTCQST